MVIGSIEIGRGDVAHRIIAARLREQILQGEIVGGMELPPTASLAVQWRTSYFTVHTALKNLEKEGFLERKHGAGTYVRAQRNTLDCIGLYYENTAYWTDDEKSFYRTIYAAIERQLRKQKISLRIYSDPRPKAGRNTILPALRKDLDTREIQELIAPMVGPESLKWLLKLPIPTSVLSSRIGIPNKISFNDPHNLLRMLELLKAKGCRTVGVISNLYADKNSPHQSERLLFDERFAKALATTGMSTRKSWIRKSKKHQDNDLARFGYHEFHALWNQPERPDAVIAFPDVVVRGVILAALEAGVNVPQDVQFAFHRNARVDLLCPFPATWEITDEDQAARAMITMVREQHQGKKVQPVYLSNRFEEHDGERNLKPTR